MRGHLNHQVGFEIYLCRVLENDAENTLRKIEFDTYSKRGHSKENLEKKKVNIMKNDEMSLILR